MTISREGLFDMARRPALSGRRGAMLRALGVAAIAVLASVVPLEASGPLTLPSNVKFQQWETQPSGGWITGALQANNSDYMEGETVPFRLEIPASIDAGAYQFSVCRNYEDGARRGYLYIAPYDTDRAATPGGTIGSSIDGFSGVNATIDAAVDIGAQGSCKAGDRESLVTITKQTGDAYVLWGGHLAAPLDAGVGAGNGAASWPGASLHMKLSEPSKDLPINTCTSQSTPTSTITPTPTLTHTATALATSTSTVAPTHTNTPTSPATEPPATGTPPVGTDTPVPPTDTPVPPTSTPVPPTDTPVPPTSTPVPPTDTPVPPTSTPVPSTNTPVPSATASTASETPVPTGTATATRTATETRTPVPSTGTPAPTETPQAATVAARAAATATAFSQVAAEMRPRQVPNTGCAASGSDGGGAPWALILIAALGGAAVAAVAAGIAVKKARA
jgi:hypothetical protein